MSERFPDLPLDDAELERLMCEHLEPVTPSAELRQATQAALSKRLEGRSRWPWALWGGALIALGALVPALAGDDPPQATGPQPAPTEAEPAATETEPAAEPSQVEAGPAAGGGELADFVLRLVAGQAPEISEDMDYTQLRILLRADVILVGTVESVDAAGTGSLRVHEVLRGDREELVSISTAGDFNGCEGVPSFEPYLEREVCLFLQRRDGALTVFHGGSGIQPLPFKGKLGREVLSQIVRAGELDEQGLLALIDEQGLGGLTWLGGQMPAALKQVVAPGVQAVLRDALRDLALETGRKDVMAVARYLDVETLPGEALETLKRYHETFLAHPLGAWVGPPHSYVNDARDHRAFLSFVARFDRAWALEQVEAILDQVKAGTLHRAHLPPYEELKASLSE